jgi:DNA-binding Lrp family transcriptional regulator
MDRTDLGIFTRLVGDPFVSDEALGRQVGLTGKAVRLRRKRMETDRVLTDYAIHPRAEILGRTAAVWRYYGPDRAELPVALLRQVEDLVYVRRFRPGFHMVVRFTVDPKPSPDPRLDRWLGRGLAGPVDGRARLASIGPDDLSRIDWKVLESLVRAPRSSLSAQARYAGVSPRTYRVHRSRLDAADVLECSMILDLEREEGVATYGLWLKVDESFNEGALELPRLWDRPHWTENPRGVYLLGSGANYFEARELELRLRSLPGVVSAEPLIPAGGWFARERVVEWVRAERERRF